MPAVRTALLSVCFLTLCLVAGSQQLSITEFDVPRTVQLGEDAELKCQYELGAEDDPSSVVVKWWWNPDPRTQKLSELPESSTSLENMILIFERISGRTPNILQRRSFSTIETKDGDNIILKNIHAKSSGTYVCIVSTFTGEERRRGNLVVINKGTGPILTVTEVEENSENHDGRKALKVTCHSEDVTTRPDMRLTLNGFTFNTATTVEGPEHRGLYKVYSNATLSAEDIAVLGKAENKIRCELSFSDGKIVHPPYFDVKTFTRVSRIKSRRFAY